MQPRASNTVRDSLERKPRAGHPGGSGQGSLSEIGPEKALEELFLSWGDIFGQFSYDGTVWTAVSSDDEHRVLTGDTPDELAAKIRDDWARGGTI